MHILTIDVGSYTHLDFLSKLGKLGYSYKNIEYRFERNNWDLKYHNEEFESLFRKELENRYDCVFTTNFYPIIARICHEKGIKYLAWSYDSPMNLPGCEEMEHDTNYVFLFDRAEAVKYQKMGYGHFYHLPLAVNCDRLDLIKSEELYKTDVSMLGQLYESTLPALKSIMTPLHREFVDKLVQTQLKVYGNWFVDDMLTDSIINDMNAHFRSLSSDAIQIEKAQLSFSIAQQITYFERVSLLLLLRKMGYKVDLYTKELNDSEKELLGDIRVHPPIAYIQEMPKLFKSSKINLNATLKNITSGISLRVLDIMGCCGFVLTNYQPEIEEYFDDGVNVVMYNSLEEAADKAKYFLSHDTERERIAFHGYEKVRNGFSYEKRISEMFEIAGITR